MRSLKMALVVLMLTGLFATQANARDHAVNGLIIGSAVGGMLGYVVGNEMDRDRGYYGGGHVYNQTVVFAPPPPPPRYYYREHYRRDYRPVEVYRKTVVVRERYGHYREPVWTDCRERGDWREPRHRHHYRDYDRYDDYRYNTRW